MKLLRCHIINYGCFHDFSYEFTDGINLIDRPNGWGKSTFISFLCAMLYGLDSTSKRNIQDNERRHYQPWQGGTFGGSLEFEISGRVYRAERIFGKREKEDSFTLYNLGTMLVSRDFSTRLGFELFGIDRAGFLKSICIPQGNPAPQYNDSLAARLTGLTQSADDISQYERALSAIDKALRFYIKTGNRGEISLLNQELDLTEQKAQEALQMRREIDLIYSELNALNQQKKYLCNQLQSVQKQIELSSISETQSHYKLLSQQLKQKEMELEQTEIFFHDIIPEESDIDFYLQSCSQLSQMTFQMQQQAFNDYQKADYLFLQSLFHKGSDAPETGSLKEPEQLDTDDVISAAPPFLSDTEDFFSPDQQQLLINSEEYKDEALLLFSSEKDVSSDEISSSPEHLPDADIIRQARECFYQYQNLMNKLKSHEQTVSDITAHLEQLQSSLEKEHDSISACQQKLKLFEGNDTASLIHDADSNEISETGAVFRFSHQYAHTLLFPLLLLAIVSCLTGYFITPSAGTAAGLAGTVIFILYFFITRRNQSCHQPEINPADDHSALTKDTVFREQIIQLKTEIQLRATACTQLEEQVIYQQQRLGSAKEKVRTSVTLTDTCKQHLTELSEQLGLPLTESFLHSDEYLTQLSRLSDQLEDYGNIQTRRYELYKREKIFHEQLQKKYMEYHLCSQHLKKLEQTVSDLKMDITAYLRPYYSVSVSDSPSSLEANLHKLKAKLISYKKLLSDMYLAAQNMNLFLKEHPDFQRLSQNLTDTELQNQPYRQLSDLRSEESILREQYMDCIQQINACQSQIHQKQEIAGEYLQLEEQISLLKLKISNCQDRYRILTLTRQYLVRARQDFTDNYLKSIEKNFNNYAQLLNNELLLNTSMTSDFHMLVSDNGVLRETGWYSQGTRDLIDLCSRLSIIEDLFPDERPFLLLDDPFVNLDDHSISCLSSILHTISDKWQILYFTCHSSRHV